MHIVVLPGGNRLNLIGQVAEIWRYPVTSMGGERVMSAKLGIGGLVGDRQFGLVDSRTGLPAAPEKDHRWRKTLHLQAGSGHGEFPAIVFPGADAYDVRDPLLNAALSDYFGFAAGIATYAHTGHASFPLTHYRHRHHPVHLLTSTSLQQLAMLRNVDKIDCRRFRPTVLIEPNGRNGFVEHQWIGQRVRLGKVDLIAQEETKRCGMTFISQPGVDGDPEILRNILRYNGRNLGIYCGVDRSGIVEVGDKVSIEGGQPPVTVLGI